MEQAKLISKCYQIDCRPSAPLTTLAKENIFKLFLFDIGLLGYMLNMSYAEQRRQVASFKGFIAENFVQNELRKQVPYPTFSWAKARGEIEFLYKCQGGEIIPVEVKSGSRSRARSLRTYVDRYSPKNTVKLIGTAGNEPDAGSDYVWPLYYAQYLSKL